MSDTRVAPPSLEEFTERASRNPFAGQSVAIQPVAALTSIEQQRGIAEVQARMIMARSNPRDPMMAMDAILRDCTRPTLAEGALYQYSRGGAAVSGPSIKLAEAIARRWGNIASGIKEVSRANGYSECISYAWDLETGYYDERQFQVRHWRDTKRSPQNPNGGYVLTDERDIYELIANMGQRRKRAVLLAVIPEEVVAAAEEQCDETLRTNVDASPEALKRLAEAFTRFGVTQAQIEQRCQCRLQSIRPAQIVQLRKIYTSLKDEMSSPADWFTTGAWAEVAQRHVASQDAAAITPKAPRKRATQSAGSEATADAPSNSPEPTAPSPEGVVSPPSSGDTSPSDAPPAEPEPPPPDRDAESARLRISELNDCKTLFDAEQWNRGAVMKAFGDRLAREGKTDLLTALHDAYRTKIATFSTGAAAHG